MLQSSSSTVNGWASGLCPPFADGAARCDPTGTWLEAQSGPNSSAGPKISFHSLTHRAVIQITLPVSTYEKPMQMRGNERREKEKFSGKNQGNCNLASNDFWNCRQLGRKSSGSQRIYTNANHLNPCCDYAGKKKIKQQKHSLSKKKRYLAPSVTKEISVAVTDAFIQLLPSRTQILDHPRNSWLPDKRVSKSHWLLKLTIWKWTFTLRWATLCIYIQTHWHSSPDSKLVFLCLKPRSI